MAAEGERSSDFYAVLGLKKGCTSSELRKAYKKLALRWHPDRCSATGDSKFADDAKKKFQAIQEAYSVLSDANKRFLYDVGAYDTDNNDDDESGMGDFLNEMAAMMTQTQTTESGGDESFEALQELFEEIFHRDMEGFGSSSASSSRETNSCSNKRNSSQMNSAMAFNDHCQTFSLGATGGMSAGRYQHRKRRTGASRRKH